jgi:hypothetical protein
MREVHQQIYETVYQQLANDPTAILTIRRFAALLLPSVARHLFIAPWEASLSTDPMDHHECVICKVSGEFPHSLPGICEDCMHALTAANVICEPGRGGRQLQDYFIESAQAQLQGDKAAIKVMRKFAALLDNQVATELFYTPAEEGSDCRS